MVQMRRQVCINVTGRNVNCSCFSFAASYAIPKGSLDHVGVCLKNVGSVIHHTWNEILGSYLTEAQASMS